MVASGRLSSGTVVVLLLAALGFGASLRVAHGRVRSLPATAVSPDAGRMLSPRRERAAVGPTAGGALRRAVVVGIDDYSVSVPIVPGSPPPARERHWRDLEGAVNDAEAIYELLTRRYGFTPENVRLLTNQGATREAIFRAVEEGLIGPSRSGDLAVFYYAGHGSRVRNLSSDEPDHLDESLVPVDSRLGAPDIRDKELRRLFNRILDRGARLTVILDSCYSGSGARGLPVWRRPRSVAEDLRDVADGASAGPRPEDRGALILSASEDFQPAWETWDDRGRAHGAFSWALLRALRAAPLSEPAARVFARTRAWLRTMQPAQEPVAAGGTAARSQPLFGDRSGGQDGRTAIAVERVDERGLVRLLGGWIDGLSPASELEGLAASEAVSRIRLRVVAVDGLSRSRAEVERIGSTSAPLPVVPGQLFTPIGWLPPPGPPLWVWIPVGGEAQRRWAQELERRARAAGITVVADPTDEAVPTTSLGWDGSGWYLASGTRVQNLGSSPGTARVVRCLRSAQGARRLFIEVPVPPRLARRLALGERSVNSRIVPTEDPRRARYVLAGRWSSGHVEASWMRQGGTVASDDGSPLPLRSRWRRLDPSSGASIAGAARGLERDASRLARVHAWLQLESPAGGDYPYRLVLTSWARAAERRGGELVEGERLGLALVAPATEMPSWVRPRYVYVFSIDSYGKCSLLFPAPTTGSVENRFPLEERGPYPETIRLGRHPLFEVSAPFGVDTFYLLTIAEPLARPWILECPGVRGFLSRSGSRRFSGLEALLLRTGDPARAVRSISVPGDWSLTRRFFRSVPAAAARVTGSRDPSR